MKCGICRRDNEPGSWHCAFCGAPLQPFERLNTVYREVQRLGQALASLEERLGELERARLVQPRLGGRRRLTRPHVPTARTPRSATNRACGHNLDPALTSIPLGVRKTAALQNG